MKSGQWWKTMGGGDAYIAMTNAPDKKCPILGFIYQGHHGIHPCCWTKKGTYFGSDDLADGKCHLAEVNPEMKLVLSE